MSPVVWDTSALAAILLDEPEGVSFSRLLASERPQLLSAVTWLELSIVMSSRLGAASAARVAALLTAGRMEIAAFDAEQAHAARDAHTKYGRGRHPAGLDLGDCASYGLAAIRQAELAFKGDDFSQTDARPALGG